MFLNQRNRGFTSNQLIYIGNSKPTTWWHWIDIHHTYTYIHTYIYIYIERERERWVQVTLSVTLRDVTQLNNLLLNVNFDKSTIGLHYIHILSMLAKFHSDKKLIVMLSINCLNSSFCNKKWVYGSQGK